MRKRHRQHRQRQQGFQLRTAVMVAVALHVLCFVGLDRYQLLAAKPLPPKPRSEPLRFVFAQAPKAVEPPPADIRQLAAEPHRASAPEPPPGPPRKVAEPQARLEPKRPPPQPAPPSRPLATAAPPPAEPPILTRPAPERSLPSEPSADLGKYSRKQPDEVSPTGRLLSDSAISRLIQSQVPSGSGDGSGSGTGTQSAPSVPRGVMDFDAKDFDWGPYGHRIYQIIERNWHSELRARVIPGIQGVSKLRFRIDRQGRIDDVELLSGSRWELLDNAAIGSVELSNPLPALPADFPDDDVGLTFSYHFNMPPDPAE